MCAVGPATFGNWRTHTSVEDWSQAVAMLFSLFAFLMFPLFIDYYPQGGD
jgi:hypothetical protein